MTDCGPITDPSNPFATEGISNEDRNLLQYLLDAKAATGIDVVATSTTDHPPGATRHLQAGTNGTGLAIDCRLRQRGLNTHRSVFDLWRPVESALYELIYADPPSAVRSDGTFGPYNIKAGKRVRPYASADHHDHVHIAVNRGIFPRYPLPPPEDDVLTDDQSKDLKTLKNYLAFVSDQQNPRIIALLEEIAAKLGS